MRFLCLNLSFLFGFAGEFLGHLLKEFVGHAVARAPRDALLVLHVQYQRGFVLALRLYRGVGDKTVGRKRVTGLKGDEKGLLVHVSDHVALARGAQRCCEELISRVVVSLFLRLGIGGKREHNNDEEKSGVELHFGDSRAQAVSTDSMPDAEFQVYSPAADLIFARAESASAFRLLTSRSGVTEAVMVAPALGRRLGRFTQTERTPSSRAGATSW